MSETFRQITDKNYRSSLVPPPLSEEDRKGYVRAVLDFVGFRKEERLKREALMKAFDYAEAFRIEEKIKAKTGQLPTGDGGPQRMKGVAGRSDGSVRAVQRPRLARRSNPPLRVRVLADFYETAEWSLGGFIVANYTGDMEPGMSLSCAFRFADDERVWFECRMNVVRRNREDKILALSFEKMEAGAFARLQQTLGEVG